MGLDTMLILWLAVAVATIAWLWKAPAPSCLVAAYLTNLWLIHWPGAAVTALPWYRSWLPDAVEAGFRQSLYAVVAFAFGALALAPALRGVRHRVPAAPAHAPHSALPTMYIATGAVSYILLSTSLGQVGTANALIAVGQHLIVVGLCLLCWSAWRRGRPDRFLMSVGAAFSLPLLTLATRGFVSYGAVAALIVLSFAGSLVRPRWKTAAAAVVTAYVGLSFFVSYMGERTEIREVVWERQPFEERLARVYRTVTSTEWFDPRDERHLQRIDQRLNQSLMLGIAAARLAETQDFARGETLWQALASLVPRAVWPDKPVVAGSAGIVSRYTGVRFAEGTSVGVGQVMEFYVNFGTVGVAAGFLVLGIFLGLIDAAATWRLRRGDWHGFALWFLIGIGFIQAGGSLVEVVSSAGAGAMVAMLVNRSVASGLQRQRTAPAARPGGPEPLGLAPAPGRAPGGAAP